MKTNLSPKRSIKKSGCILSERFIKPHNISVVRQPKAWGLVPVSTLVYSCEASASQILNFYQDVDTKSNLRLEVQN